MSPCPVSVFLAARQTAGVVAASHRGDSAGTGALLAALGDERTPARGFPLLAGHLPSSLSE